MQIFKIKSFAIIISKLRERNRGKVANGYFVLTCIFNNFCAEIGTFDRSKVLLVRLTVAVVFVKHIGSTCFNLGINDLTPKPLGFDSLFASLLLLILKVKLFEFFTPAVKQSWAFVWAHESPVFVLFNSLHEKIWDPESVEQVTSPVLLSSIVFTELKEFIDVWVPWLKINCKSSFPSSTLINIPRSVVINFKHRNKAV